MNLFLTIIIVLGAVVAARMAMMYYVRWYFTWENRERRGMGYFGRTLSEKHDFKAQIKRRSFLMPLIVFIEGRYSRLSKKNSQIPSIHYEDITAPSYSTTKTSIKKGTEYQASSDDVFVVTQMKCGTTWMQQIVFEVLSHGKGDLSDSGYRHLNGVSAWLESVDGISVEQSPKIGSPGKRIIKTHLPVSYCPFNKEAKYIYVIRHPASCFASIVDYFKLMGGKLAPSHDQILEWYCSSNMWFTPWPDHVTGWEKRSSECSNILICHFEKMKEDLKGSVLEVSKFLKVDLSEEELENVVKRSSFDYMKANEEQFEMSPPNFCSVQGEYFRDGSALRYQSVLEEDRKKIHEFCLSRQLDASSLF